MTLDAVVLLGLMDTAYIIQYMFHTGIARSAPNKLIVYYIPKEFKIKN